MISPRFRAWCGCALSVLLLGLLVPSLLAQTSATYQNKEHVINAGGNPVPALTSTTYNISLSSIGDGLSATGMHSASYSMDGGFVPSYPPPGEVLNVRFTDKTTFVWNPEASVGTYDVYRGLVSGLSASYGTCLASGLTLDQAADATSPTAGQCFFYLVTAKNRLPKKARWGRSPTGRRGRIPRRARDRREVGSSAPSRCSHFEAGSGCHREGPQAPRRSLFEPAS